VAAHEPRGYNSVIHADHDTMARVALRRCARLTGRRGGGSAPVDDVVVVVLLSQWWLLAQSKCMGGNPRISLTRREMIEW
jgi:hypothetical protein